MDQRIEYVLETLRKSTGGRPSIVQLARTVNLSVFRLHHLFKTETGTTPARYLKGERMQMAALLLDTTFLSVKEIAYTAGFLDYSHFVRDFKSVYGSRPSVYRIVTRRGRVG